MGRVWPLISIHTQVAETRCTRASGLLEVNEWITLNSNATLAST